MDDVGRLAVGAAWVGAALLFLRRDEGARRGWTGAAVCGVLASFACARWHVALLRGVRASLRDLGIYGERAVLNAVIGVALALVLVLVGRRLATRAASGTDAAGRRSAAERVPLFAACAALAYVLAQTAFLDDVLPALIAHGPGRFALEGTFALVVLAAQLARPRR